jgi:hypothetical protein
MSNQDIQFPIRHRQEMACGQFPLHQSVYSSGFSNQQQYPNQAQLHTTQPPGYYVHAHTTEVKNAIVKDGKLPVSHPWFKM